MTTWSSLRAVADGEINRVTGIAQVVLGAGTNNHATQDGIEYRLRLRRS